MDMIMELLSEMKGVELTDNECKKLNHIKSKLTGALPGEGAAQNKK